jgi:hypothetical protein
MRLRQRRSRVVISPGFFIPPKPDAMREKFRVMEPTVLE